MDEAVQNFTKTLNSVTQQGKLYLPPPQLAELADNALAAAMAPFLTNGPFEIGPERNMSLLNNLKSSCNKKVEAAQRVNVELFESRVATAQAAIEDFMQEATRGGFTQEGALAKRIDAFVKDECACFERGQQYFHAEEEPVLGKYRKFRNGVQRRREDALRQNLRALDGILAKARSKRDERLADLMRGAAYIAEEKLQDTKGTVIAEIEDTLGSADGSGLVGEVNWHKVSMLLSETEKMFVSKIAENRERLRKQVKKSVDSLKDSLGKLTAAPNGSAQRYIPHEALQSLISDQIAQVRGVRPARESALFSFQPCIAASPSYAAIC